MPGLQQGLHTAAAAKVTAAVYIVATEATATAEVTAGALKATAAAVVSTELLQLQFADAAANLAAHCRWLHCMCNAHAVQPLCIHHSNDRN